MPSPIQVVPIPLNGGLDQATDSNLVQAPAFKDIQNLRFRKAGSLSKRFGWEVVANHDGTSTLAASSGDARIFTRGKEVLVGDGHNLYSYTPNIGVVTVWPAAGGLLKCGKIPEAYVESQQVGTGMWTDDIGVISADFFDYAASSAETMSVWIADKDISGTNNTPKPYVWTRRDKTTGAPRDLQQVQPGSGTSYFVRVKYFAGGFVIVFLDGADGTTIRWHKWVGSTFTSGTLKTGAGSAAGPPIVTSPFEIDCTASDFYLFWFEGANYAPRISRFNTSLTHISTRNCTDASVAYKSSPGMCVRDGDQLVISYHNGTDPMIGIYSGDGAINELVAPAIPSGMGGLAAVSSGICSRGVADYTVAFTLKNVVAAYEYTYTMMVSVTTTLVASASQRTTWWAAAASKPFVVGAKVYLWVLAGRAGWRPTYDNYDNDQPPATFVLCDTYMDAGTTFGDPLPMRPVGVASPTRRALNRFYMGQCSVVQNGAAYETLVKAKGSIRNAYEIQKLSAYFGPDNDGVDWRYGGTEFAESAFISGGILTAYDGARAFENGFVYEPYSPISAALSAGAGLAVGTFRWAFVYACQDAAGNVHRSAPSIGTANSQNALGTSLTNGGGNGVATFELPVITLTTHDDPTVVVDMTEAYTQKIWIEVYRTWTNGTALYLRDVVEVDPTDANGVVTYVDSNTYAGGALTQAVLESRPRLYTDGGAVPNVIPPSFRNVCGHKNRLFGIERNRLWWSKERVAGEGVAFADEFTWDIEDDSLCALASLDDKLIIFGRRSIRFLSGAGPLDTAEQNDFQIAPIAVDIGCKGPRSVVVHSGGVFFRSDAGIYNLNRGLQLEYLGALVDDEVGSSEIGAPVVHPTEATVYFPIVGTAKLAVWDYTFKKWLKDSIGFPSAGTVAGSAKIGSSVYLIDHRGWLYKEQTNFLDRAAWVTGSFTLGWVGMGGPEGWQSVKKIAVVGEKRTAHGAQVDVYTNWDSTAATTATWTEAQINAMVSGTRLVYDNTEVFMTNTSQNRMLSVKVTDTAPATLGTGEGARWLGITMEIAQEPGTARKSRG